MSVSTIIFIALVVGMVWMHTRGHGGCGGHGSRQRDRMDDGA